MRFENMCHLRRSLKQPIYCTNCRFLVETLALSFSVCVYGFLLLRHCTLWTTLHKLLQLNNKQDTQQQITAQSSKTRKRTFLLDRKPKREAQNKHTWRRRNKRDDHTHVSIIFARPEEIAERNWLHFSNRFLSLLSVVSNVVFVFQSKSRYGEICYSKRAEFKRFWKCQHDQF